LDLDPDPYKIEKWDTDPPTYLQGILYLYWGRVAGQILRNICWGKMYETKKKQKGKFRRKGIKGKLKLKG
jgi:hypothetical protein